MKLVDVLLLGVAIMFLIIGIDQSMVLGFAKGYWAFMLALAALFAFNYRKSRRQPQKPASDANLPKKHKRK